MNIISNGLPGNSFFVLVVLTKNGNYNGPIISGANRGLFPLPLELRFGAYFSLNVAICLFN